MVLFVVIIIGEQASVQWCQIENWGYLFIYVCGRRYAICTLTLVYFCVSSVFCPIPNFTKQNPPVYRSLPVSSLKLNCFVGAVKTKQHTGVPFLFELVAAVS